MTLLDRADTTVNQLSELRAHDAYVIVRTEQIINELITRSRGDVPDDTLALIARILIDENAVRVPAVHYRRSRKMYSTGRCYKDHIVLTIGTVDAAVKAKWIAIHEVTHWLTEGEHHSPFFYERAFELYERYGCNMETVKEWEFNYKKSCAMLGYALYMRSVKGVRWTFADGADS